MMLLVRSLSSHERCVICRGHAIICHCMCTGRLVQNLGHWGRIIEKQHVQVLLQILMCLSLWHHILCHSDWFISIVQLIGIENILSLIQKTVWLCRHIYWRMRAHIQSQLCVAQTAASLLTIEIQIKRLRLHTIRFLLTTPCCLESVARICGQPAQVQI